MTATEDGAVRRRGRPRSTRANEAILTAALELLAERRSIEDVSVEAVAARAGTGKATIYRRWESKEDLFTDAVATLRPPLPGAGGRSARQYLVAVMEQVCSEMRRPLDQAISALMMSTAHPGLRDRIKRQVFAPRNEAVTAALRRGIAEGRLRPDLDPEAVLNLLIGGALVYERADSALSARRRAELLVDTVWRGIALPERTGDG